MCYRTGLGIVAAVFLCSQIGCASKVRYGNTFEIPAYNNQKIDIDAPTADQKIHITAESDEPVDVEVFLKSDEKKSVGEKKNSKNIDFEVDIPAKAEFFIKVTALSKKVKVTVKANSV